MGLVALGDKEVRDRVLSPTGLSPARPWELYLPYCPA